MKRTRSTLAIPAIFFTITLLLTACGSDEQITTLGDGDTSVTTIASDDDSTATTRDGDTDPDGNVLDSDDDDGFGALESEFVGLSVEDAGALADAQDRPWRISRQDDEFFATTDDYRVGRVTFEVDSGLISSATIERPFSDTDAGPSTTIPGSTAAGLISASIVRIVTEDNSFGGGNPFDVVFVATLISADFSDVDPLALEQVAEALQGIVKVDFIPDAEGKITDLFGLEGGPDAQQAAVVSVDDIRIDGESAEIDMGLWCGSLCGIWLTYEAEIVDGSWQITGTTGPIAIA